MKTNHRYTQIVVAGGAVTGRREIQVPHDQAVVAPMTFGARLDAYVRQNGDRRLTARQERQLDRMFHRAAHKVCR